MPTFEEGRHDGEFLVSEANGDRSREEIVVVAGQKLSAGSVLGKITASGKFRAVQPGGADGSEGAAGILWGNTDATAADQRAAMIARDAEVNWEELEWPDGTSEAQKATARSQLAALGILTR